MTDSVHQRSTRPARRRLTVLRAGPAAAMLGLGAYFATIALASATLSIDSASNATLKQKVLVNSQGRTLYVLSPETAAHLLCKSNECLKVWPPLSVPSRQTKLELAAGVHGRLGILQRSDGTLQVTLDGRPLYRFSGDRAGGQANGQNLGSFGGIWHVLTDAGTPSAAVPASSGTPTTPSTPGGGYEY